MKVKQQREYGNDCANWCVKEWEALSRWSVDTLNTLLPLSMRCCAEMQNLRIKD